MATSNIPRQGPYIILRSYSCSVSGTFSAREHRTYTATNFGISAISGYTPAFIHTFSSNMLPDLDIIWVNLTTSGNVMGVCTVNAAQHTVSGTLDLTIGWVRNDLIL